MKTTKAGLERDLFLSRLMVVIDGISWIGGCWFAYSCASKGNYGMMGFFLYCALASRMDIPRELARIKKLERGVQFA